MFWKKNEKSQDRHQRVRQYYGETKKKRFGITLVSPIAKAKNIPKQYSGTIFGRPFRRIHISYLHFFVVVLLAIILIYFLLFSPFFRVRNIIVVNNKVLLSDDISLFLRERNIGEKNIFLLNTEQTKDILKDYYRRIEDVRIYRVLPGKLKIKIQEKPSTIIWQTGETKYLLDNNGYIIGPAEEDSIMPMVLDKTGLPVKEGDRIVTGSFIDFVNTVDGSLSKRFGLGVVGYSVDQTTFDLRVDINSGFYLLFGTLGDPAEQLDKLSRVYDYGEIITQYVILSVEGKVIVK